jgi:hypothetical protein
VPYLRQATAKEGTVKYELYKRDFVRPIDEQQSDLPLDTNDDLGKLQKIAEAMVRGTGVIVKPLADVELIWKCVNDGSQPENMQVYDLWSPFSFTGYVIWGPSTSEVKKDG